MLALHETNITSSIGPAWLSQLENNRKMGKAFVEE
jgi:hypothetical protein